MRPSVRSLAAAVAVCAIAAGPRAMAEDERAAGQAAEQAAEVVMPEALREPALDPFSSGPVLRAHRLRGLTAEVAGLILGRAPGGDFAFEALATPLRAGGGAEPNVPLFVEIDGATFLESNQSSTARVEIYAYALTASRQVAGFLAEVFALDVQALGEAVWQSGLKYYGHLVLPPGDYRLRVLIRNFHSGASALRELPLSVPAFETLEVPFVLCPFFSPPPSRDAWLPVREARAAGDYPFAVDGRAVAPAVRPVLIAGRRETAQLFAYGVPPGHPHGRVELLRSGATAASRALEVHPRRGPLEPSGAEAFEVAFDVPAIEPGIYSLRAYLGENAASEAIPVVVLQPGTTDRGLLWTDLRGRLNDVARDRREEERTAAAPEAEKKVSQAAKRKEEQQIRELAESYRRALSVLGQGSLSDARSALLDLESRVLTDGSLQNLQTAQLLVAEELAARELESLIPVLALHDAAYLAYRQRSLFSLGFNARAMIETLAELYAERGGTQGSRVVAARALASLGGHLQEANLPSSSRRLYRRALEHDPANLAALLGLATSFERYGEYGRAVEILDRLAAVHPDFGEGLLRFAVNVDRLGQRDRCRLLLRRVLDLDTPEWVRALAYQTLARIALETGNLDRAAELLEAALQEIPRQQGSIYLLAHVYDRRREAHRALTLLRSITPDTTGRESARKHYDSWPEAVLDAMRNQLAEAAEVRGPLVARILDGDGKKP